MSVVASTPPLGPDDSTFYYPSDEQLKGSSGEVIWVRPLTGAAALTAAASNELVLYRSRDVRGKPIAVSGIIALPKQAAPAEGYSVISWAHGTVGCADHCAPSRDVETSDTHKFNSYVHILLNEFLNAGWAVVMTDYEGLGTKGLHPYQLGESEARGILDIVLAARSFHPEISNRLAIVGHSQGGQAALFAAHHHAHTPGWKPEIDLRGVAALAPASGIKTLVSLSTRQALTEDGEPPVEPAPSDPDGEVDVAEGQAFTALFVAGAIGGDPSIQLEEILTENALARFKHTEERCRVGLSAGDSFGGLDWSDQLRSTPSDSRTKLIRQLAAMHPAIPIDVPIRISQAALDKRVLAAFTDQLRRDLINKHGNRVDYEPYLFVAPTTGKFAGLGAHFGLLDTDRVNLVKWLKIRFGEANS